MSSLACLCRPLARDRQPEHQLDLLEAAVPGLRGRLDRSRIAAAGHSFGGQTAGNLLGLRVLDPEGGPGEDLSDSRIKAGVLFATAGQGGADLTPFAAEHFPFMNPSFAEMTTPTLVVAGDQDNLPLSVRAAFSLFHQKCGRAMMLDVVGQ